LFAWEKTKEEEKRGEVFSLPFHKKKESKHGNSLLAERKQTRASR